MNSFNTDDTIAAISTPVGKAGIGVVRLSGPDAIGIIDKIFFPKSKKKLKNFESFSVHYGWIGENKDEIIDEVLLIIMRAPKTYTTQDITEISCHSGVIVLRQILDLVLKNGSRLAKPGEFTQRAFINGRIDLTQAEAVLDIIESKTPKGAKLAIDQLDGKLTSLINKLKQDLLEIYVKLEASVDFPEESETEIDFISLKDQVKSIASRIKGLINTADKGQLLREGRSLVICGRPNVGKSCLMNALLRKDRVIVTSIPGTTRDAIEESISIEGIPFKLIDTAGMISSSDVVEKEGIKRSKRHLELSDLVILVLDISQGMCDEDKKLFKAVRDKAHIVVLNKIDLKAKITLKDIKEYTNVNIVKVSAIKSKGIKTLEKTILDMVWEGKIDDDLVLITNQRHKQALVSAYQELVRVNDLSNSADSSELASINIKACIDKLSEVTGEIFTEDILDRIFSQFCIGK